MALTGAMSAGIAGLKAHMDALTVVGNNVANVNTPGYKAGRVTFKESIYSTQAAGSNGTDTIGGTNPRQTGYGCSVGTIDLDMSSMNVESTGNAADVAIQGDGFLLVGSKEGVGLDSLDKLLLTRVGDLRVDNNGYLTDGYGNIVYGFVTCNGDENGKNTTPGLTGDAISTQLVPIRLPRAATKDGEPAGASVGDAIYPGGRDGGRYLWRNADDGYTRGYRIIQEQKAKRQTERSKIERERTITEKRECLNHLIRCCTANCDWPSCRY